MEKLLGAPDVESRKGRQRMRHCQRENVYYCGNYMDVQIFPVRQTRKYQRRARFRPTSDMQAKLNERNRIDYLWRTVNLNFGLRDLAITLTYMDDDMREESAENEKRYLADWARFTRRLRKLYRERGLTLKYAALPHFAKNSSGYHFHVFMTGGVSFEEIEACWQLGIVHNEKLMFDENGVEGYIRYVQGGKVGNKKWFCSKNLTRPEPKQTDGRITKKEMFLFQIEDKDAISALYPGYVCTAVSWEYNELYGGEYARARFYKQGAPFYYDQYKKKKTRKNGS